MGGEDTEGAHQTLQKLTVERMEVEEREGGRSRVSSVSIQERAAGSRGELSEEMGPRHQHPDTGDSSKKQCPVVGRRLPGFISCLCHLLAVERLASYRTP